MRRDTRWMTALVVAAVTPSPRDERLLRPVRGLDDVHEIGALIAGDETFQDVRLDVGERGLRLRGDAFGERLQDVALEVGARMQSDDLGPVGIADIVVSDAEHV